MLCQNLLLATSHSCNLLVYCLSNPAFRKKLYVKLMRKQSSDSSFSNSPTVALHNLSQRRGYRGTLLNNATSSTMSTSSKPSAKLRHSLSVRVTTRNSIRHFYSKASRSSNQPLIAEYKESRTNSIATRTTMIHREIPLLRRNNSI